MKGLSKKKQRTACFRKNRSNFFSLFKQKDSSTSNIGGTAEWAETLQKRVMKKGTGYV